MEENDFFKVASPVSTSVVESNENEMIALFLAGELTSERFGDAIRATLDLVGTTEELITAADIQNDLQNAARRELLAATRGYGQNLGVFENFPTDVRWVRTILTPSELARVRYIEYSYWNELSNGTRLASDAARQIRRGVEVFGVSNERFLRAARAVERGELFPPLILAGSGRIDWCVWRAIFVSLPTRCRSSPSKSSA